MESERAMWHAAIAHELRTPVTILRGRLQGLAEGVFQPDESQFRSLLAQVEGLSRLIEDLRVLSLSDNARLDVRRARTDVVAEVHDTHHPIAASKYYEEQKTEAKARAASLRGERLPKFLGHFEQVLAANGGRHALREHSYVDLSLFQLLSGLDYMFPRRMQALAPTLPLLRALHERVAKRPNIAAYLASERRLAFNTNGIFRHYPELDAER
ncbi:hypothetical protein G6F40_013774 [Rhizopus arrhizus]|nr:hypothetical protein G6F40_013774 [Rhizopus arrhizus]